MRTVEITWSDVKRRYVDSVRHGKPWRQAMQDHLAELHRRPYARNDRTRWQGGNGADTLGWLDDGYRAPELADSANVIPTTERVRVAWSEEDGDVDAGRLYGGYDDFYLATGPSETRPGLTVTVDCFFAWTVPTQVVKDYGAWVAGLLGALEANGYDLRVDMAARINALCVGDSRGVRSDVLIRVKQFGELSDFTEWSAMFSPTATRHLLFTAFGVAADKIGKRMTDHCASAWSAPRFGVEYDAETNHLRITAQQHDAQTFPAERMNEALAASGLV